MGCDHKFVYGGVKFKVGHDHLPGTSAKPVTYYDWFYCEKCLENQYIRLSRSGNTYEPVEFNATPYRD